LYFEFRLAALDLRSSREKNLPKKKTSQKQTSQGTPPGNIFNLRNNVIKEMRDTIKVIT
jgi:hypothetical protein